MLRELCTLAKPIQVQFHVSDARALQIISMSEYKQYTLAEVATHNSNKSVWFVIHNNIYDVTEFLNEVKCGWRPEPTTTTTITTITSNNTAGVQPSDKCADVVCVCVRLLLLWGGGRKI